MGKLGEGEQFLKDQLRKRSGDIQLTFFLGVAMAKQGKLSEAQQVWRQIKDECKEARKYMEAAEKVLKGEKTLEEADFRMLIVAKTMEVL
jgi:cytochrome c-type biogenesis protein CcmH/NrfG